MYIYPVTVPIRPLHNILFFTSVRFFDNLSYQVLYILHAESDLK